jgi:hypothetical protein
VRPLPEPPPIGPRISAVDRAASLPGDEISEMAGLEDAWARHSEQERLIFLRNKVGSIMVALSPEQLQELAAQRPPAYVDMAGNIDLLKQSDKVKRKTRDGDTFDLCAMLESAVRERRTAAEAR